MSKKAIDKEYLLNKLKNFEEDIIDPKYLDENDFEPFSTDDINAIKAKFSPTYSPIPVATIGAAGLMSAADKSKLDELDAETTVKYGGSSAVGSSTKGVYVDASGNATAMTYELNKTVPADAKFTDTTYESKIAASGGTDVSLVTTGEKYTWNNKVDKNGTDSLMTATEHTKLAGIATGAEVNVQSDWNQTTTTADDYIKNKPTTLSSFTDDSTHRLVTDTEKSTWNAKTSNTGTVTKVSTGVGLTGGDITTTGTIKANLKSETQSTLEAADKGSTASREYAVGLDKNGNLSVNVPWTDNNTTYTAATDAPGNVSSISAVGTSTNYARQDHTHGIAVETGDSNGQVKVAGINASVKGLGSAAYTNSTAYLASSLKGANSGVAELDSNGKVPTSQLPSYVDDVLEYTAKANFPSTGEAEKIYVDTTTNLTYRWSGTAYVEISPSLALGETSSTAYRGDRGKAAYDHASAKGSAFSSGLYKITTNAEGHVTAATVVAKSDITGLGIPGSLLPSGGIKDQILVKQSSTNDDADWETVEGLSNADVEAIKAKFNPNYSELPTATTGAAGLMSSTDKAKLNSIQENAEVNIQSDWNQINSDSKDFIKNKPVIPAAVAVKGDSETSYRTGNVNITKANIGLGNVGNFKAVSTVASQGLTDTEKANARANIGAGTSSFSGNYNDLSNKPTIPTVNNGTLTIQKNGANVTTFTANQSGNATANITVPTKTSDITNDSGFISYKAVSTVASQGLTDTEKSNARVNIGAGTSSFSGNYNDLSNKPTIPVVNNATLTIQKNGTTVKTFTTNASSDVTANITVPTKVSDLTNDSGFTTNTGTVTQVKVGTNAYNPSNGIVALPSGIAVPSGGSTGQILKKNSNTDGDTGWESVEALSTSEMNEIKAKFSPTYSGLPVATTSNNGLMSSTDKSKLNGIAAGAEVNIQADWNVSDSSSDAFIKNKPTIPTKTSELTNNSGFITNAGVIGVKGNSENEYRSGNVNITAANIGLGNVGNFKAVSTVASQGLTDTEKANARTNIGAGTSNFSGSYNDLTNKPTIPSYQVLGAVKNDQTPSLVTGGEKYEWTMKVPLEFLRLPNGLTDFGIVYDEFFETSFGYYQIGYHIGLLTGENNVTQRFNVFPESFYFVGTIEEVWIAGGNVTSGAVIDNGKNYPLFCKAKDISIDLDGYLEFTPINVTTSLNYCFNIRIITRV